MQSSSQHSINSEPTGVRSSILSYTVIIVVFYSVTNISVAHEECPTHPNRFAEFKELPGGMLLPMSSEEMMAETPPLPLEAPDLTEKQSDKVFQILRSAAPDVHEKQKIM